LSRKKEMVFLKIYLADVLEKGEDGENRVAICREPLQLSGTLEHTHANTKHAQRSVYCSLAAKGASKKWATC
jgi:hypothetical protein